MMKNSIWLLPIGSRAYISTVETCPGLHRRLMELGFCPGHPVRKLLQNRCMAAYLVQGTVIALRKDDAMNIITEEGATWD